jgi:hypothetical protein
VEFSREERQYDGQGMKNRQGIRLSAGIGKRDSHAGPGSGLTVRQQYDYRLATALSRVFDPFVMFAGVAVMGLVRSHLTVEARVRFIEALVLGMIAPPFILLSWAVARKKVSDWDISDRRQRPLALGILLVLAVVDLIIVAMFGDDTLFSLFVFFLIWLFGFFMITVWWKISGHVGAYTLFAGLAVWWFGWQYLFLLCLIPMIAWARIRRKDHTFAQVAAGAAYSFIVMACGILAGRI